MTRLGSALEHAGEVESRLAAEFARVARDHGDEPDVFHLCALMTEEAETRAGRLAEFSVRHGAGGEPPSLLADLVTLFVRVQEAWIYATVVRQAALATRDPELLAAADTWLEQAARQAKWLTTRIKTTAPQALTVE